MNHNPNEQRMKLRKMVEENARIQRNGENLNNYLRSVSNHGEMHRQVCEEVLMQLCSEDSQLNS